MPKPIRILHILDSLGRGGMENGLVNLLQQLEPNSFEHVVCTIRQLGENAAHLPADRVRTMCLHKTPRHSPVQIPALVRLIRTIRPNIVHSRNWGGIEAVVAARLARSCSTVHSEHGLDSATVGPEPWRRTHFRRLAYELADRVVTVSDSLKAVHTQRTGLAVSKISVIHNGVDTLRFAPNASVRARIRQELGLSDSLFCIGAVGNLFAVKDHLTLLKACRQLARCERSWRLFVIGEGPERSNLESFAASDADSAGRIVFLGSSDRVPDLLQAMDLYVLPSLSEGISNSLLEAMSTGIPPLATRTGGNPEVIEDGHSGLLFPVSNHQALASYLQMFLTNLALRSRLRECAMKRVREHFSLDSMTNQYRRLYSDLALRPARETTAAGVA